MTKTQSHDSVHLCISGSLLLRWPSSAPLQLLATAHECPGRTLHTHPCHIDTVTVSASPEEEENINREAEGGVEELQYLKHVLFAALLVCLCAIFLPAVYLVAWISRGRNEAAPGSLSCAAHGDVLLSTYCLLRLNLPHFSGYTLQGLLFLPFRVCAVE